MQVETFPGYRSPIESLEMSSPENLSAGDTGTEDAPICDSDAEEQAFLVGLHQFMKERKTPIERLPHLGFKQINLWRLHQAAEKLGGYQLVTGGRLWKNVYDELGGSPGSTSAATCTRRHYERLLLPYVQYLKGEDDKTLPFPKPRKKYKVPRNEKDEEAVEDTTTRDGAANDEELLPEKRGHKSHLSLGLSREISEQTMSEKQPNSYQGHELKISGVDCCCDLPWDYDLPFANLHFKEKHGILSPLAKKKLLAQASKARDVHSQRQHCSPCSRVKTARTDVGLRDFSTTEKGTICQPVISQIQEAVHSWSGGSSLEPPTMFSYSVANSCSESQSQSANHSPAAVEATLPRKGNYSTAFSGYFEVYKSGHFDSTGFRTFKGTHKMYVPSHGFRDPRTGSCVNKAENKEEEQPMETANGGPQLSSDSGESCTHNPPLFQDQKACWVSPIIGSARSQVQQTPSPLLSKIRDTGDHSNCTKSYSPEPPTEGGLDKTTSEQGRKFKAISPFLVEGGYKEYSDCGFCKSPAQVIHKPKPIKPCLSCGPSLKGIPPIHQGVTCQRFSTSFHKPKEHQKSPHSSPSLLSSLPFNPIILPEFPGHMSASLRPSDPYRLLPSAPHPMGIPSLLHNRLYTLPMWHIPSTYITSHMPSPHSKTKQ